MDAGGVQRREVVLPAWGVRVKRNSRHQVRMSEADVSVRQAQQQEQQEAFSAPAGYHLGARSPSPPPAAAAGGGAGGGGDVRGGGATQSEDVLAAVAAGAAAAVAVLAAEGAFGSPAAADAAAAAGILGQQTDEAGVGHGEGVLSTEEQQQQQQQQLPQQQQQQPQLEEDLCAGELSDSCSQVRRGSDEGVVVGGWLRLQHQR